MNYRSISDLSRIVQGNACLVPEDVDLIVGIPRSGMLPASMLALQLNRKVCDLNAYLSNSPITHGRTRKSVNSELNFPQDARHILVIDDSVRTGASVQAARELIDKVSPGRRATYCAVYAEVEGKGQIDLFFEILPVPRIFEWNLMHRKFLAECCMDIDGVLCHDPSPAENDDGDGYRKFLLNARPLAIPTYPVGHLVTSRLEKYRAETQAWLSRHGIEYQQLHMLDLPDAATRRKLGSHAVFKADVYSALGSAKLFIESEANQAAEICNKAGKPVLCFDDHKLYRPGLSYQLLKVQTASYSRRIAGMPGRMLKKVLGG